MTACTPMSWPGSRTASGSHMPHLKSCTSSLGLSRGSTPRRWVYLSGLLRSGTAWMAGTSPAMAVGTTVTVGSVEAAGRGDAAVAVPMVADAARETAHD